MYKNGKKKYSCNRKLKAIYLIDREQKLSGVKIAVAIAKKTGTAVWRNKLKRLIRESYGQGKQKIIARSKEKKILLRIIFSSHGINEQTNRKIFLPDIQLEVKHLLDEIFKEL